MLRLIVWILCCVSLKKRSALKGINWERIILDEGHFIKNPATWKAETLYVN